MKRTARYIALAACALFMLAPRSGFAYAFCGGDPVNTFDPDGRCGKQYRDVSWTLGASDSIADRFLAMPAGFVGAILMGIGSTPSVFDQASQEMGRASQEISTYSGGQAFLANTLRLPADLAFGTTRLVNDPMDTVPQIPGAIAQLPGNIGQNVRGFANNPSMYGAFNLVENGLQVWGLAEGGASLYRAGANVLGPRTVTTPWGVAVQEASPQAQSALGQVQNGATVYKGGFIDFANPVGAGPSETVGSQFLSLENPLSPGYAGRYGIPPQNQNFNFVLTGRVRPGAPVITRSAPGIPPNPGGGVEAVTSPNGFQLDSFYMP